MARILTEIEVKIVPGSYADGGPFTNLLHRWTENGTRRFASSRISDFLADTPHNRAYHIQAFKQRQARYES
jgi:hypothetical protein